MVPIELFGSTFAFTRYLAIVTFHFFSAPPPGPLQSLAQWLCLPQFLNTTAPSPDPLLRLPDTKASRSSGQWLRGLSVLQVPVDVLVHSIKVAREPSVISARMLLFM